ncbi:hypothetical protein [Actinokineospora pegani]|uniref:hypothetical protein n=1 Tax=Actinokineospora pegani TaxID=2654637 RepID=UPI0012EAEFF7|nr:hypothetical protein [Actinokineospora pegani]
MSPVLPAPVLDRSPVAPPPPPVESRRAGGLGAVAAVAVPGSVLAAHAWAYGRWIVDDAAITFAYARSVAEGLGPVLQPGADPVEGYSNPAWLALLVVGRLLGLFDHGSWWGVPDLVAFPKLLALLCALGVFACFHAIARVLTRRPALVAAVAGVVLACVPSWVVWLMSGLENGLLALATAGIATVLARAVAAGGLLRAGPAVACGLLAALAALTRPDGLIYAGAYPVAVLLLRGGEPVRRVLSAAVVGVVAFALPAGAYLAWRISAFGEPLPNTALAKAQGTPGLDAFERPVELAGYLGPVPVVVATALVVVALARPWPARAALGVLLVPFGLAVAAHAILEQDWMGQQRFATPVWTLGVIVTVAAAARVVRVLAPRWRAPAVGALVVATVASGAALVGDVRDFRARPTVPMCLVAEVGHAADGYADRLGLASGTVLAPDIGGLALTTRLTVVDLVGLADAPIARHWAAQDMPALRDHVFDTVQPTMIMAHSHWLTTTGIDTDPRITRDYARVAWTVDGGHWVRRTAIPSRPTLHTLRDYATQTVRPADAAARRSPRASCPTAQR